MQVQDLLERMNLGSYKENFHTEQIDGVLLLACDEEILECELGVASRLHRMRILKLIKGDIPISSPWQVSRWTCSTYITDCNLNQSFSFNAMFTVFIFGLLRPKTFLLCVFSATTCRYFSTIQDYCVCVYVCYFGCRQSFLFCLQNSSVKWATDHLVEEISFSCATIV